MNRLLIVAAAATLCATPAQAQQRGGLDRLMAMDANGDGAITRAEAEAARGAMFNRLDRDRDGYLSTSEQNAAQGMGRRGLEGADADNDARISRAELMAQPYRAFDRLDANSDGAISAAELETVRTRANAG